VIESGSIVVQLMFDSGSMDVRCGSIVVENGNRCSIVVESSIIDI